VKVYWHVRSAQRDRRCTSFCTASHGFGDRLADSGNVTSKRRPTALGSQSLPEEGGGVVRRSAGSRTDGCTSSSWRLELTVEEERVMCFYREKTIVVAM
jgi:hypothetical protein